MDISEIHNSEGKPKSATASALLTVMTAIDQNQSYSSLTDIQSLMHSLQRLMKIGLYYPDGHAVLAKATSNLRRDLVKVARDNASVHFAFSNERLFLETVEIPQTNAFVNEFARILKTLGIDEIEIDREAEGDEITSFLQKMLQYHAQAQSSHNFQQIDFKDLPFSIRITQKEFLTTCSGVTPGKQTADAAAQPTLEQFMERLQKKGVEGDQLARCRVVMESLVAKDLSDVQPQLELPHVDWYDIEQLLIRITGHEGPGAVDRGNTPSIGSLNSLASILHALEKHTSAKRSKEAINLLISVVKNQPTGKKMGQTQKSSGGKGGKTSSTVMPVARMEDFVQHNHPGKIQLSRIFESDHREELGILILQLEGVLPLDVETRIYQSLRNILSGQLNKSEWEILVKGTRHVLRQVNYARLDSILKILLPPLRRSQPASSISLLNQVLAECNPQELRKVWPYAVNELIRLGSRRALADFRQLCNRVASLPMEDQVHCLPFLQELDSFKENTVAPDVCSQLPLHSYPMFGLLLKTSLQSQLVSRIIHDFTLHPPEEVMETVIPFLDRENPLHVQFLRTYLQQSRLHIPVSLDAARLAGQIIVESLLSMPREKRAEVSVLRAISVMAELRVDVGRPLLESIVESRRWLFIPEWPASCREKAAVSLRKLQRSRTAGKRLQ